jgi:hypothetical protein
LFLDFEPTAWIVVAFDSEVMLPFGLPMDSFEPTLIHLPMLESPSSHSDFCPDFHWLSPPLFDPSIPWLFWVELGVELGVEMPTDLFNMIVFVIAFAF